MAVSLCDGMAYRIMEDEIIERSQALSFFLNGHIEDALLVYDRVGKIEQIYWLLEDCNCSGFLWSS